MDASAGQERRICGRSLEECFSNIQTGLDDGLGVVAADGADSSKTPVQQRLVSSVDGLVLAEVEVGKHHGLE